jgi:AICAR transformylase/IMP cyclohydrolase PurH
MLKLQAIPQYDDSPISWEYLDYKLSMGSYKATDKLLGLLEFCSCLFAGADAFDEYSVDALKEKLQFEYRILNIDSDFDPIEMAFRWAWPPNEGNRIVYNAKEVKMAVEALFKMVCEKDPREVVSTVVESYLRDAGEIESSAIYIGQDLKVLGIGKEFVEQVFSKYTNSAYENALLGYTKGKNHA